MDQTATTPANSKSPLSCLLPANVEVLSTLRRLSADPRSSIENQGNCALKDPIIALELLKTANSMAIGGNRSVITSIKGCIQRLGASEVINQIRTLDDRVPIDTPGVSEWIEQYRIHCHKVSLVSGFVAQAKISPFIDECRASSLFTYMGDMLAAAFLKEEYVVNASSCVRKVLNYRLAQKYQSGPDLFLVKYLQRSGVPEVLIFPLARELATKDSRAGSIRPIHLAAYEIFEAFLNGKKDKYKTQKDLPSSSVVKVLQLNDNQFGKLIEQVASLFEGPSNI